MENFIIEFKNALDSDFCRHLIKKFESSSHLQAGRTGSGVDKTKKDSTDLYISKLNDWDHEKKEIENTITKAMGEYTRWYPFILTGAIAPMIFNPETQTTQQISHEDIAGLTNENLESLITQIYRHDNISLQRYTKAQGGYHHWHSEQYPQPNDHEQKSLHRVLLWLLYLNDVEEGGETDFFYQKTRIKPRCGSLVLAPCGFTHTHRGCIPISEDKYVLASWVLYQEAEKLYGTTG